MYFFIKNVYLNGSFIKHFIISSVKTTEKISEFLYDSAKLKSQFNNSIHD